jgi:hypothetical protein
MDFEVDDDWWAAANMAAFVPKSNSYRSADSSAFTIPIEEVAPLLRVPLFRDDPHEERKTAGERVLRLFLGFRADAAIPPVTIIDGPTGSGYRYKLTEGAHRFYCSLAAGFTHVPAVKGFDRDMLDR